MLVDLVVKAATGAVTTKARRSDATGQGGQDRNLRNVTVYYPPGESAYTFKKIEGTVAVPYR